MSLNGLDAPAINQAHQALQQAPAGWLLLRYATRDSIELYSAGSGGTAEVATKVAAFEEKSPLYGLIAHEGRKVLIKYVPGGTSRLLQARVKVHFEALSSHFPHDSELSLVEATELTDAALSTAFLVTPTSLSPSISLTGPSASNQPLERKDSRAGSVNGAGTNSSHSPVQTAEEEADPNTPVSRTAKLLADVRAGKLESHEVLAALKITSTRDSDRRPSDNSLEAPKGILAADALDESRQIGTEYLDQQLPQFPAPRPATSGNAEARPQNQKVKLGPRPAASPDLQLASAVASLPAGISMPQRTPVSPPLQSQVEPSSRPTSSQTSSVPFRIGDHGMFPIVQSPASVIPSSYIDRERPTSRAASVMTMPISLSQHAAVGPGPKSPEIQTAPEKDRLMRALEMRKKHHAKQKPGDEVSSAEPSPAAPRFPAGLSGGSLMRGDETGGVHETAVKNGATDAAAEPAAEQTSTVTGNDTPAAHQVGSGGNEVKAGEDGVVTTEAEENSANLQELSTPPSAQGADGAGSHLPGFVHYGEGQLPAPVDVQLAHNASGAIQAESGDANLSPTTSEQTVHDAGKADEGSATKSALPSLDRLDTVQKTRLAVEESDLTPVAVTRPETAEVGLAEKASTEAPRTLVGQAQSRYRPPVERLHSADVSISTSLSGDSFLEELNNSAVEEAQPVQFVKSPITPSFPISPGFSPRSFFKEAAQLPDHQSGDALDEVYPLEGHKSVGKPSEVIGEPIQAETAFEIIGEPVHADTAFEAQKIKNTSLAELPGEELPIRQSTEQNYLQQALPVEPQEQAERTAGPPVSAISVQETQSAPKEQASPPDDSPLSVTKGGSPASKKHPTVQPPHIWGGPLRAASQSPSSPPRHLSPAPDLQKLTRSATIASSSGAMLRPDSPSGVKKAGVGSRIADRIKALEQKSGAGPPPTSPFVASSVKSVSSRKSSFNTPPGSSGTDASRKGPYPTPSPSPGNNIFSRRFGTVHSSAASDAGRSDRTIRASPRVSPEPKFTPVKRAGTMPSPTVDTQADQTRPSYTRQKSSDSRTGATDGSLETPKMENLPPSRDGARSPNKGRGSFSSGRVSLAGHRDSFETVRTSHSRQSSVESTATGGEKKKDSKAKKLMKRVSGAFSPRKDRHGAMSPSFGNDPIQEAAEPEPEPEPAPASVSAPVRADRGGNAVGKGSSRPQTRWSENVVVGEVNVQFPDTLLWKRRHVELDGDGNIILMPSSSERSSKIMSKRFHITEFRQPYIPDQEREELPYSIILDFQDSSTLQCACQNSTDQMNVLSALVSFHNHFNLSGGR